MKPFVNKKTTKNLIIILALEIILSGLIPNSVQAKTDTNDGGGILEPIEQFVVYLCDNAMQWLQDRFTSTDKISKGNGVYEFEYSPAIIFSGKVPALDINFITPKDKKIDLSKGVDLSRVEFIEDKTIDSIEELKKNYDYDQSREVSGNVFKGACPFHVGQDNEEHNDEFKLAWYNSDQTIIYYVISCEYKVDNSVGMGTYHMERSLKLYKINVVTYESTASVLQTTIATWYNALRRIALVGLLSVLVYVGIRIVLTSSSSDKAKYKGMLKDWIVAICILFTLHYIMSITITVTNEISNIFATGESDKLLNTLRADIYEGIKFNSKSWGSVLAEVIMYAALVINTFVFTVQYLMRVIYMAFYTLIAPLITLTYPLDKIKDGQAQAFNMWIKEYIFTALTQIIHLVIYFVLVGSALDLVKDYPLYAIIVLMFMKKAEGIIKKMFGFDKAETVGTLGAAVTGGLVMNAFNKIGSMASKGAKGGSSSDKSGGDSNSSKIRTAGSNPLAALQGKGSTGGEQGLSGSGLGGSGNGAPENGTETQGKSKADILAGGALSLGGKFIKKGAGAALNLGGAATGAMLGFAGGVAQGDIGKAFAGAAAGAAAGKGVAQGTTNFVSNIGGNVRKSIDGVKNTWNEGAYGADFAQNAGAAREFKRSSAYKGLKDKFGDSLSDENLRDMLAADITDARTMEKILESGDVGKGIAYYTMAKDCDASIYYDPDLLRTYVTDIVRKERGEREGAELSQKDADKIIKNMKKYR